jgi:diacylglycerol kinase family enzyme
VVAAGGDGTVSLAADHIDRHTSLIPMPLGTENLLARHFGYGADAESVLHTSLHGRIVKLDAGRANGRLFLIMVSCGFDAEVVRLMQLRRRGHIRRFHYAGPIVQALCRYRFPKLEVRTSGPLRDHQRGTVAPTGEGRGVPVRSITCCWAMVFNLPRYGGGLSIEPAAVGDDGLLDLVTFRDGSLLGGLKYIAAIKRGRQRRLADVVRERVTSMEISSKAPVSYQIDGDYGGQLPLRIETIPRRVRLKRPPR